MKVTFTFSAESQAHKAIEAIMCKMKFYEESRVATGGYMSEPAIMVTYSGAIMPSAFEFGQNNYYVMFPAGSEGTYFQYYSLLCPEGFQTNDIAQFQKNIDRIISRNHFEVKSLDIPK
jgi:hypothetical protein